MATVSLPSIPEPLRLVSYPHPALRRPTAPVTVFGPPLRALAEGMFAVMATAKGVGLAAPQVAVSLRLFITDHVRPSEGPGEPRIWANPRIVRSEGEQTYEEGCLSFPGIYAKVTRPARYTVAWDDETGAARTQDFDIPGGDFLGVVVLHELDHLEGRLFVDYLNDVQIGQCRRRLRELEADYKAAHGASGAVLRR
jgi:peptide deformylase